MLALKEFQGWRRVSGVFVSCQQLLSEKFKFHCVSLKTYLILYARTKQTRVK